MLRFVLVLSSTFFLVSAEERVCDETCTPCVQLYKELCKNCSHSNEYESTDEEIETKRQSETTDKKQHRYTPLEDLDIIKQNSETPELIMPTMAMDYYRRLPPRQRFEILKVYSLYDYYLRALRKYQ